MKRFQSYFFLFLVVVFTNSCGSGPVLFSVDQDIQLGNQVAAEIESNPKEYPILSESKYPKVYDYMQTIVNRIVTSPAIKYRNEFAYKDVKIIQDDKMLNAFATPGGHIYVYTGLIKYLDTEDELAGVLGHEIAHAELRHSIKQLERQYGISLLLQIATGQNPGALAQVATALGQLKFSRSAESESDAASVTYLSSSPYRCDGAAGFFKKMQEQGGGAAPPEFLSTHPAPANRIQAIENKAKEVGCKTTPYNPTSFDSFKKWLP